MDMDAILVLASLISFLALVVTWLAAPLRAPAPAALTATEATQPVAA
jgi:hypothetical protein